jgi:hypothetical protein
MLVYTIEYVFELEGGFARRVFFFIILAKKFLFVFNAINLVFVLKLFNEVFFSLFFFQEWV